MNPDGISSWRQGIGRQVLMLMLLGMCGLSAMSCGGGGGGSSQPPADDTKAMNKISLSTTPNLNCEIASGISALNESTGKLYVSCVDRGVGVIDTGTMQLVSIIPIENYVSDFAVTIDVDKASNKVFVGQNTNGPQDRLIVIDGVKDTVSDRIVLADKAYLVLCDSGRGEVHVISNEMIYSYDVGTHTLKSSVSIAPINAHQQDAVLRLSSGHVFVPVQLNKVREYDPDTGIVIHEYHTDYYNGMAIDDVGGKLFLAKQGNPGRLSKVDIDIGSVDAPVSMGAYINSVMYDASLNEVYVLDPSAGSLSVVDPSSSSQKAQVAVKGLDMDATLAIDETRDKVYVIDPFRNTVSKIDGISHSVEQVLPTGLDVANIAVNSRSKKVFVMENTERKLYTFDAASGMLRGKASVDFEEMDRDFYLAGISEIDDKVYIQGLNCFGIYDAGSALDFTDVYCGGLSHMAFDESQQVSYYTNLNKISSYKENRFPQNPAFQYASELYFDAIDTDGERNRLYVLFSKLLPSGINEFGLLSVSTVDGSIIRELTLKNYPVDLAVDPVPNTTAVITVTPSLMNYYLELVDNETLVTKQTVSLGSGVSGLDLNTGKHWLYVTNYLDDTVTVFDMVAGRQLRTIATGPQPNAVAVDRITGTAYVLNSGDASISVIDQ